MMRKPTTPKLTGAPWEFIRADTPKKLKRAEKKLKAAWRKAPSMRLGRE